MTTVLLVPQRHRVEARDLAARVAAWLQERGHSARISESDNTLEDIPFVEVLSDNTAAKDADVAISLGGDGTMLHAIDLATAEGIPVLGINAGHLGYLTTVPAYDLSWALDEFFAGNYEIEERMTLHVEISGSNTTTSSRVAINEVVVEKTVSGHTVHLAVEIGGRPFLTYAADGMIVATPTGSTAYNMSARGPIVSPHLQAIVITPVSPHMLFDRALVISPEEFVRIEVLEGRQADLVVDGVLLGELAPGDSVTCSQGKTPARLVTFGKRDVHGVLRSKFGLSDR
jgi:NAD+ kinase